MITQQTYRSENAEMDRAIVSAYSALDFTTTKSLSPRENELVFRRTLSRIIALVQLHGPSVPRSLISYLVESNEDPVEVIASFLETGTPDVVFQTPSELQQEIVHFSRIFDLVDEELEDGQASHAMRRMRGSRVLPDSLKTLAEFQILARSRLLQRKVPLAKPSLRAAKPNERDLDGQTTVWDSPEGDFVLVVQAPRRRVRRIMGFRAMTLMQYVTPVEAAFALWAHGLSAELDTSMRVHLVFAASNDDVESVSWQKSRPSEGDREPALTWLSARLPIHERKGLSRGKTKLASALDAQMHATWRAGSFRVEIENHDKRVYSIPIRALVQPEKDQIPEMLAEIESIFSSFPETSPLVHSLELAHVHLDRQIDIDQEIGAILGNHVGQILKQKGHCPVLTPMLDDDHVITSLRPREFCAFLDSHLREPYRLIPESSPIVRSIVVWLWFKIQTSKELRSRCVRRGGSMMFQLGANRDCIIELFEDFDGEAVNGCVFFELGLLIYRLDPQAFDDYFIARFKLEKGLHHQCLQILDDCDQHDHRVEKLKALYERFHEVTRLQGSAADPGIARLIESVLERAKPRACQLNVLEDYYTTQQRKVREFIAIMNVPITLLSLHFSAQSGRVALHHEGTDTRVE